MPLASRPKLWCPAPSLGPGNDAQDAAHVSWQLVAREALAGHERTEAQCCERWSKVLRPGLVKGPWTADEDRALARCIARGIAKWSDVAAHLHKNYTWGGRWGFAPLRHWPSQVKVIQHLLIKPECFAAPF